MRGITWGSHQGVKSPELTQLRGFAETLVGSSGPLEA
jgi:hypothetical protein